MGSRAIDPDGVPGGSCMFELLAWLMPMVVGAGLLIPLLYALGTLLGMHEKRIYLLLRLRARDGAVSSLRMTRQDAV